jgi:hypothetical protein
MLNRIINGEKDHKLKKLYLDLLTKIPMDQSVSESLCEQASFYLEKHGIWER